MITREQARLLAIESARTAHELTGSPSYYVEPFEPHAWVVDAVLAAIPFAVELAAFRATEAKS